MARIPESDLRRLKEDISVQRLIEASGIELKKAGKDWLGRCPYHGPDTEPSLNVSAAKNLWHCFGCDIGGGPIDWVMKGRGVSFRHAVELLKADPGLAATAAPFKRTTVRALPAPVTLDADDRALLRQTIDYYHERLRQSAEALAYLAARGLDHSALVDTFKLGVADRTLGLRLPQRNRVAGATIRERLQRIGLLRETGHEHFNGSLVVPLFDEGGPQKGNVVEVYGRKLQDHQRAGVAKHLYLRDGRDDTSARRNRGVFNLSGVIAAGQRAPGEREVILTEACIDAMSFWCAGFTNVTSSFGAVGFTADILATLKANGIERVLIAYDRDDGGDRGAAKLAPELIGAGFEVLRVLFPKGMDANEYACKMKPADKAFALVLRQAQWLGGTRPVLPAATTSADANPPEPEPAPVAQDAPALRSSAADPAPTHQSPMAELPAPRAGAPSELPQQLPEELQLDTGAVCWRVRGWKKNASAEVMKVNLSARRRIDPVRDPGAAADATLGAWFVDSLDLYAAKSRAGFVRQAATELGIGEDACKRELGALHLRLEALHDALLTQARERASAAKAPVLSADEEAQALELLRAPNLIERIVSDLHAMGVVGEDLNLLAAYLAAVSRKLDAPLAVLIQSSSAAGKSSLMDAVLQLVPEEDRIRYSAMTGQSLFYLGETNLQHKILAIAEEEGVRQAAYALKLLQSDGELTIASTAKDETTGNLSTRQYTVKGPVMLMLTTTAIDLDEELLNRCLVLAVNESREQTVAIHARQRHKQTLEGLLERSRSDAVKALHHNAQRLLASLAVVNSYAGRLTFLADKTRTRRDHMKYLTLIRAIALLHQHQREVKTAQDEGSGQSVSYIEVTPADIELANAIAHEVLGRTLDELPAQTRRLLNLIGAMVRERAQAQRVKPADVRFTRKDIRDATQWSDNQLKVHCARLADMEFVLIHGGSRGHRLSYELLWDGSTEEDGDDTRHLCGLIDTAELDRIDPISLRAAQVGVPAAQVGVKLAPSWAQVGPKLDPSNGAPTRADAGAAADRPINGANPHSSGAESNAVRRNVPSAAAH